MNRMILIAALTVWANGLALPVDAGGANLSDQVRENLRRRIEVAGVSSKNVCQGEGIRSPATLSRFYKERFFYPAWTTEDGPLPQAESFIQAAEEMDKEGLKPGDYPLLAIRALLAEVRQDIARKNPLSPAKLTDLDLRLTDTFLILASHLLAGRVNPETIQAGWQAKRRSADLSALLQDSLGSAQIEKGLKSLIPPHSGYARLRQALGEYRNMAQKGGWAMVPGGPQMGMGDGGERVRILRARLISSGDLGPMADGDDDLFDEVLEKGVRKFQERHGLEINGIVDLFTLAALSVPVEERVRQIELNMERWRWLPANLGPRYIQANIANFGLEVVEQDHPVMTMRVIVGKPGQRTPVFSSRMTHLVLNPHWNVPQSIARKEILPLIQKNPDYLAQNRFQVFQGWGSGRKKVDAKTVDWARVTAENLPYNFRQEAGPMNELGRVKFMFPNKFDVYLHDTPWRGLFARTAREFSHGCLRIEKPIELAEYLLRDDPRWTRESILAAIDKNVDRVVRLPQPIAVHLLYWTAWVDGDGSVQFRNDIHGWDRKQAEALAKKRGAP